MKLRKAEKREAITGLLFSLPFIIGLIAFFLYPLITSIVMSFSQMTDLNTFSFSISGVENYIKAFAEDTYFAPLLISSLTDALINTPTVCVFALFVAVLLNMNIKGKWFFRTGFLLPVLIGGGVVMDVLSGSNSFVGVSQMAESGLSGAESQIVNEQFNLGSGLEMLLGSAISEQIQNVLEHVSSILWMSGVQIIIFLGALQTISAELYEAAHCDGATEWECFWKITFPMITPILLINVIYTMIDYLSSMKNEVIIHISNVAFGNLQLTYGSALSWLYFLVIGLLLLLVFVAMRHFFKNLKG